MKRYIHFSYRCSFFLLAVLAFFLISLTPLHAWALSSDELFEQAESVLAQVDELQTSINEETAKYNTALSERDAALAAAQKAEKQVAEEQKRMDLYRTQLALLVTEMYKSNAQSTFLDVVLEAQSFEDFLTTLDSLSKISGQGADLVKEAKLAKAAYEASQAEYEKQTAVANSKMEEADASKRKIESKQEDLRQEAEKLTKEAAEMKAQEDLEREAARQAAAAAEALLAAEKEAAEKSKKDSDSEDESEDNSEDKYTGSLVLSGSGLLNHPLPEGIPSSPFGWRDLDGGTFHMGFDLAAAEGTPYYAAANGTVVYATNDGGYNGGAGNWIVISHGDGLVTIYMHSSKVFVEPGDTVRRGQKIGEVGNTGHSYGAHLHFQVEYNGVAVDPTLFI